jgi:tetratricopeptide (TPR) repeat protein
MKLNPRMNRAFGSCIWAPSKALDRCLGSPLQAGNDPGRDHIALARHRPEGRCRDASCATQVASLRGAIHSSLITPHRPSGRWGARRLRSLPGPLADIARDRNGQVTESLRSTQTCTRRLALLGRALVLGAVVALAGCINLAPGLNLTSSEIDRARLERALDENPNHAHALLLQGRSELSLGNYASARRAFDRALKVKPDLEEARLGIAVTYLEQQRWSSAARSYEDWIALNANAPGAWSGLAAARYGQGRLDDAKAAAQKALDLNPSDMLAHRILGEVAYARGEFGAALHHWQLATQDGAHAGELEPIMRDLEKYVGKYGE